MPCLYLVPQFRVTELEFYRGPWRQKTRIRCMPCGDVCVMLQGVLALLEILEIYWKFTYKVYWKFCGLVCEFVRLSLILEKFLYFRVYQYKMSCSKPASIDIEVSNFGKCQLTHLLIGIGVGWGRSPHASSFNLLTSSKRNCKG